MARLAPNAYVVMVCPDLSWPSIADPLNITAADHAAHTQRPGLHRPEDLGFTGKKHMSQIRKVINKTLKLKKPKAHKGRRKDERN